MRVDSTAKFITVGDAVTQLINSLTVLKENNFKGLTVVISKEIYGEHKDASVALRLEVTSPLWITHYIRMYRHGVFVYEGIEEVEEEDKRGTFIRKVKVSLNLPDYVKLISQLLVLIEDMRDEQLPQEVWEYLDENRTATTS